MAGPSWLIDGNRFATKIKCASGTCDAGKIKWKSNPSRMCPSCHHTIDNNDVIQDWPGLPRGVKFDPTDQEIIQHLTAKSGTGGEKPHPFIDEFIPTVDEEDGICYTHPRNLPGVKQDGTASHFFHRTIKAYNTGTRKRRKIHGDDLGDVRWHKTGRTTPVSINGVQKGCKKIMVLYICTEKRGKPEKTNWVMHQYHLGTEQDEKDGDFIISKVFYQQQQLKQSDKAQGDISDATDDMGQKLDPVTPKSVTPERPGNESRHDPTKDFPPSCIGSPVQDQSIGYEEVHDMVIANEVKQHKTQEPETTKSGDDDKAMSAIVTDHEVAIANEVKQSKTQDPETAKSGDDDDDDDKAMSATVTDHQVAEDNDNQGGEEILWDSESQYMLNSQQLVEGLSLCDDLLQSQSPPRDESGNDVPKKRSILSEYARLGPEDLKKDLEECQNLVLDPSNIDLDTPPEFRLSQLEFGSQESFGAWGLDKMCD